MITLDLEPKEVYNEKQKKFYQFLTCIQHAHECFSDIEGYLLFNRKIDVGRQFKPMLDGTRKQRKKAEKAIEKDNKVFHASFNRFKKNTGELYAAFSETTDEKVAKEESEMSVAMYEFFDNYFTKKV
jgi:hypothetical protein